MIKKILFTFLFGFTVCANANTPVVDQNYDLTPPSVTVDAAPDIFVEMLSIIFPHHAKAAVKWLPSDVTSKIIATNHSKIFTIAPPETPYVNKHNNWHNKLNINNKDLGAGAVFEYLLKKVMIAVAVIIVALSVINALANAFKYMHLNQEAESNAEEIDKLRKRAAFAVITAILGIILFYPNGENETSFIIVFSLALAFIGAFCVSAIGAVYFVGNFDSKITEVTESPDHALAFTKIIVSEIPNIAIARIINDAVLESTINNKMWHGDFKKISNELLVSLGTRQQKINEILPSNLQSPVRADCYLNRDWLNNAAKNECRWVAEQDNGIDRKNLRLMLKFNETPDLDKVGDPVAQYLASQIKPLFENAINDYDDWFRSQICQEMYGKTVHKMRFAQSLVCAKRTASGSLISGEYHGYKKIDENNYVQVLSNVEENDGRPIFVSTNKLVGAVQNSSMHVLNNKTTQILNEKNKDLSHIYVRGALDQPWKLTAFLTQLALSHQRAKTQAAAELGASTFDKVNRYLSGSFSQNDQEIRFFKGAEMDFLDKFYPILSLVWHRNLGIYVTAKYVDNGDISVTYDNPMYKLNDRYTQALNMAIGIKVATAAANYAGIEMASHSLFTVAFKAVFWVAVLLKVTYLLLAAFLLYVAINHIFRLISQFLIAGIAIIRQLVEMIMGSFGDDEDWLGVNNLKIMFLNTILLQFVAIICYLIGITMSYFAIVMGFVFVDNYGVVYLAGTGNLVNIGWYALKIMASGFMVSACFYMCAIVLPYNLYLKMVALIGDEADLALTKNEGATQILNMLNPFR